MDKKSIDKKLQFIEEYQQACNAATGSKYDSNANVTTRNLSTLQCEIGKKDIIDLRRAIVKEYLTKLYGEETAEWYTKDIGHHTIYQNDESSLFPYTYSSREVVNIKYNGNLLLVPMEHLYSIIDAPEELLDEAQGVWGKFPTDLYILDRNGWVSVTRVIKKIRHRDLVHVKTSYGEDIVVTDNHPLIISDDVNDTVNASNGRGHKQFKYGGKLEWHPNTAIDLTSICQNYIVEKFPSGFVSQIKKSGRIYLSPNKVQLTEELGYFVGFFIGDGNYLSNDEGAIQITQKDRAVLEKLSDIAIRYFNASPVISRKGDGDTYNLHLYSSSLQILLRQYFRIGNYAQNKTLPFNILETNKEFAKGVVWGIIDSDGNVDNHGRIYIRLSSRTCVNQLMWILKELGFTVGSYMQEAPVGFKEQIKSGYTQNYTLWCLSTTITNESLKSEYSFKACMAKTINKYVKYKDGWVNIDNVRTISGGRFLDEQNAFIYDITTASHSFICNNLWVHNCASISLYPFLLDGLKKLGGSSGAPKHADSFIGGIINLLFMVAAQFAGAIAIPEFITYFDHFLRVDYGEDYISHLEDVVDAFGNRNETLRTRIFDWFQQFIYSINQPAGARNYQSPFTNIAYFDEYYFKSIFKDFVFPDGDEPKWETTKELQKLFMRWFNEERTKEVLTFPVETANCLVGKDGKYKDDEMADFFAEMWSKGHSFFMYQSDSVDALASCCFSKDQKVLARSNNHGVTKVYYDTFENIGKTLDGPNRMQFKIFHNGSWCEGTKIILPNRPMYKITTSNKKEIIVSDNHIHPTIRGNIPTTEFTTNDYLMFNTRALDAVPEQDLHLTYEQGFTVGAFLGDGSFGATSVLTDGSEVIYGINFSQNIHKYDKCIEMVNAANHQLGGESSCKLNEIYNNVYPVRISSKALVDFIVRWTNWERGTNAHTKELNMECLLQSVEFRRGILDGWYNTDGGNSNRCYTVSPKLAENMEVLITSLGMSSIVDITDRTDEPMCVRGETFHRNYPLYTVRWYDSRNKRSMGNVYKVVNNSIFFKITSIEPVDYDGDIYCFEMKNNDEPYFTLPNGIITHNCRLKNEIEDNVFSYTLGAGGVKTGSKCVITLNINRITQDWYLEYKETNISLKEYIGNIVGRVHKYLNAWNEKLWDDFRADMLPVYREGFIDLDKQYLTVGVNGIVEGAEFLRGLGDSCPEDFRGIDIDPFNDGYREFVHQTLGKIRSDNKAAKTTHTMYNLECVPGENLSAKLYSWDKKDGYVVPENRVLYNSYFYPVEEDISPLKKFYYQGEGFATECDGGVANHVALDAHLTKEQYRRLMEVAVKAGCNYWTYNIPNTVCNECDNIDKRMLKACPKCGSTNIDYATRIIGYLKRISNFSAVRQEEASMRHYAHIDESDTIVG